MRPGNPLLAGVLAMMLTAALVVGGLSLSFAEVQPLATTSPTEAAAVLTPVHPVFPPAVTPSPTITQPSPTSEIAPSATICPIPAGWQAYQTQPGDTFELLANVLKMRIEHLREENCLPSGEPGTGMRIFLPPQAALSPTPTGTPPPCSQPAGWIVYFIRPGDNLSQIASAHNTTLAELRRVNCLGNSSLIQNGQQLFVPVIPTESLTPPFSPTQTGTIQPTQAS
ncbi:MAG: LysM peptidoglycan-binding domain-containing protein [Anaerolineaceae bacterium]|nr:LysM peptidoglycan-binding domain-containing protein [Anaerolineaceae bacterium]